MFSFIISLLPVNSQFAFFLPASVDVDVMTKRLDFVLCEYHLRIVFFLLCGAIVERYTKAFPKLAHPD